MIFLLTPDQILYECLQLARHQIAEVLQCHPTDVTPKVVPGKEEGQLDFEFSIDHEQVKGPSEEDIKSVIRHVYWDVKEELEKRIEDSKQTRDDILRKHRGDSIQKAFA